MLDSILKSRDITLPTKVPLVKAMVFPVVIYGCESWTYLGGRPLVTHFVPLSSEPSPLRHLQTQKSSLQTQKSNLSIQEVRGPK